MKEQTDLATCDCCGKPIYPDDDAQVTADTVLCEECLGKFKEKCSD